jgi:hypothetical protein
MSFYLFLVTPLAWRIHLIKDLCWFHNSAATDYKTFHLFLYRKFAMPFIFAEKEMRLHSFLNRGSTFEPFDAHRKMRMRIEAAIPKT